MNTLVYDIEIKKAIVGRNERQQEGIEYCAGFHDHANMGISCIGAYDYGEDRYRVFMDDNYEEFLALAQKCERLVSFNGLSFDSKVIRAYEPPEPHGLLFNDLSNEAKNYDLLVEVWAAAGLGPTFKYPSHAGFCLDACAEANFGKRKTGNGALAPVDFQRGRYGSLIDYCLNDVALTKRLFDRVLETGLLIDPRDPSKNLTLRKP